MSIKQVEFLVSDFSNFLRINVGFIAHQTVGYSRKFPIELPSIQLAPEHDPVVKDLSGVVRVTRTAQGLLLQIEMGAMTSAECSRCLDPFEYRLEIESTDLYAFSPDTSGEVSLILPEDSIIDLSPIVRDEMLLAIPINPICKSDCKGLCPICGINLNENSCDHDDEDIDPRLDALKSLLEDG